MPQLHRTAGGSASAVLTVVVKPNARSEAVSVENGTLMVRVKEPAREGKANAACCRALARALDVAPSVLRLIKGARAKRKVFVVTTLTTPEVALRLRRLRRE